MSDLSSTSITMDQPTPRDSDEPDDQPTPEDAGRELGRGSIWVAVCLSASYVLVTVVCLGTAFGEVLLSTLALHVPAGRIAALGAGMAMEAGLWLSYLANIYFCLVELAIIMALLEHGDDFMRRHPWIRKVRQKLEARADAKSDTIKKWGVPGLVLLVAIPIIMTGPWVGMVLGHLMKLKHWVTLLAVWAGSAISMAIMALILKGGDELYQSLQPPIWVWALPGLAVVGWLFYRWHKRDDDDADTGDSGDAATPQPDDESTDTGAEK